MRVQQLPPAAMAREWPAAKPVKAAKAEAPEDTATGTPEPTTRSGPPGLQKVLDRLRAIPDSELTGGQKNAMTRIERNLQRYLDNQGVAPEEAAPENAPPATEEAIAATAPETLAGEADAPAEADPVIVPAGAPTPEPTDPTAALIEALTDATEPPASA